MKKLIPLMLALALILSCIIVVGCGGDDEASPGTEENGSSSSDDNGDGDGNGDGEQSQNDNGGDDDDAIDTIEEIVGQLGGVSSVSYELEITYSEGTGNAKWWYEDNKARVEMESEGNNVVMIIDNDAGTSYMYSPDTKQGTKSDIGEEEEQSIVDQVEDMQNYQTTILGSETVDGKSCMVVMYTFVEEGVETQTKCWIWKKHGITLRMESTTGGVTTVTETKNIDFSDIPDSMFEVPDDIDIIDLSQMFQ